MPILGNVFKSFKIGSLIQARRLESPQTAEDMFNTFGDEFKKRARYNPGLHTLSLEDNEGITDFVKQGDWVVRVDEKSFFRVRGACFEAIQELFEDHSAKHTGVVTGATASAPAKDSLPAPSMQAPPTKPPAESEKHSGKKNPSSGKKK